MSDPDLTRWNERYDYAIERAEKGPIQPTADHMTLLRATYWNWNDCEFGAASMDPKRPYGNSDVDGDLAELLPHLQEEERLRLHCELSAVLMWLCQNVEVPA